MCAALLATSVQGCFFLDIKCKVNEFIEKESSMLIGQAKGAFEQAIDHVFDNDISPLMDRVQAAVDASIDKVDKYVNETINHIESSIDEIIHDAAQTANQLASNVTHDIEEIISKATSAIEQVEKTFYRDASNLLVQINQIVQKGQCMEAGGAKQLQDAIYKLLKSINPLYHFSSCWRSLGFKATMSLEDLTDIELYNYQKQCTLLNKITPQTPIKGPNGILQTYAQGQLSAAEYFCIGETANAPAFQDVLTKEWLWWGVQYNAWNIISKTSKGHAKFETDQSYHEQRLKDDLCDTPVECYAEAIKALHEAEQKISGITIALSNLNHTVEQVVTNQVQMKASILTLTANMSANGQAIRAHSQAIHANSQATLASSQAVQNNTDASQANSIRLANITVYPCNCTLFKTVDMVACPSPKEFQGIEEMNSFYAILLCCDLCVGTAKEATEYALAHPPAPLVQKKSNSSTIVPP